MDVIVGDTVVDSERIRIAAEAEAAFDFQRGHVGRGDGKSILWRARQPIVPAIKRSARVWGELTASRRVLPDFLMIGAKRAGSTTLYRGVVGAEDVSGLWPGFEQLKGCYYFDARYDRGERWYRSHMPTARKKGSRLVGEATPAYLASPVAPRRAAQLMPDAKIIAVLRDPIERAHSHYRERFKQQVEFLPSFEAALDAEPRRLAGEVERLLADDRYVSWNHLNFGYVEHSRYAKGLRAWFEVYPPDQVLVVVAEDMYADPQSTIEHARRFLGLPEIHRAEVTHHNRLEPAEIAPSTRAQLRAQLEPDVRDLERLLGRSFPWAL